MPERLELGGHRRVDVLVGARDLVPALLQQARQGGHGGAADAREVDLHATAGSSTSSRPSGRRSVSRARTPEGQRHCGPCGVAAREPEGHRHVEAREGLEDHVLEGVVLARRRARSPSSRRTRSRARPRRLPPGGAGSSIRSIRKGRSCTSSMKRSVPSSSGAKRPGRARRRRPGARGSRPQEHALALAGAQGHEVVGLAGVGRALPGERREEARRGGSDPAARSRAAMGPWTVTRPSRSRKRWRKVTSL